MSMAAPSKVLTEETLNPLVLRCQYGVRGEIFQRAQELMKQGHKVTFTSTGNPHQLGQQPLTFLRQVMALCAAPFLLDDPRALASFPSDAVARARHYLAALDGGLGAYQDSKGNPVIREEVCDFIARRDGGFRPSAEDVFLTNGASEGVRLLLQSMIRDEQDGILVPLPQYPLYSASIALYGGRLVGYHLDEDAGWGLGVGRMQAALDAARAEGVEVRAVVVINPGNPTGQCLKEEQLRALVRFAHANRLVILADEVYQENVYGGVPFTSCHKVLSEMGAPYAGSQELVSFHSVSKGTAGECGIRGGYAHLCNLDEAVRAHLYKLVSINLSPSVPGMVAMGCYVNPPRPGDASYEAHARERSQLLSSLTRRARAMSKAFNSMPGISCQPVDGAMYAFPRIAMPPRATAAAERLGKSPDMLYCLELLQHAHIAVTPGASFQQEDGTFHFRTTILPPEERFAELVERFRRFHVSFMRRYAEAPVASVPETALDEPNSSGGLVVSAVLSKL
mmetsp:Transcript_127433/g.396675  ORF Transcript_127433/g.396675 Transcript_127433/m.396675 type:complete len:508 (+) Transcript_127433:69-1592(+)